MAKSSVVMNSLLKKGKIRDYTVFTIAFLLLTAAALTMNYYAYFYTLEWKPPSDALPAEKNAKTATKYLLLFAFVPYVLVLVALGAYMFFTFSLP